MSYVMSYVMSCSAYYTTKGHATCKSVHVVHTNVFHTSCTITVHVMYECMNWNLISSFKQSLSSYMYSPAVVSSWTNKIYSTSNCLATTCKMYNAPFLSMTSLNSPQFASKTQLGHPTRLRQGHLWIKSRAARIKSPTFWKTRSLRKNTRQDPKSKHQNSNTQTETKVEWRNTLI